MTPSNLSRAEQAHLLNLIEVLLPHPEGLRRWSVMRAIRSLHEKAAIEIPLKLEDEIERVFRRHGGDYSGCGGSASKTQPVPGEGLFCRPKDRAGEVWAVDANKARAWLRTANGVGTRSLAGLSATAS